MLERGSKVGKYEVIALLGRGGAADVYLALSRGPEGFKKLVVVKLLRKNTGADEDEDEYLKMFLDEARLAARLNHPNVVNTHEVGTTGDTHFIAMEYVEGRPLNQIYNATVKAERRLAPGFCARIISDALAGLHHAHELADYDGKPLGIVHRDISPHNILVSYEGQAKIVDFGIAKAAGSVQTATGVLKGKVRYMAPEQARGETIDRRADIFAMGICLWELLTLKRLVQEATDVLAYEFLQRGDMPRVVSHVPDVDPVLDDIVARSLAKSPDRRYQTALEMRDALEEWMSASGESVRQEDVGRYLTKTFEQVRQDMKRHTEAQLAELQSDGGASLPDLSRLVDAGDGKSGSASASALKGISLSKPNERGKRNLLPYGILVAIVVAVIGSVAVWRVTSRPAAPANASPSPETTSMPPAATAADAAAKPPR